MGIQDRDASVIFIVASCNEMRVSVTFCIPHPGTVSRPGRVRKARSRDLIFFFSELTNS
jgi:hypothetical protein